MANETEAQWMVCRKFKAIPVPALDVLPSWAERGRLLPDDYLANSVLEVCVQAKEVPELEAIFVRTRSGPFHAIVRILSHLPAAFRHPAEGDIHERTGR